MGQRVYAGFALLCLMAAAKPLFAQVEGQWTASGSMQSAREENAQALISGGNLLAMGGVDNTGTILASAEIYNAAKATWASTGSMQAAREAFPAVALKTGKVLVSGGLGIGGTALAGAELFDPATKAWTPAGSLSVARYGHTATLLPSGKVLVTGGCSANGCATVTAISELYDPTTNSWSVTGSLNTARTYHAAVLLKTGEVLAIGGFTSAPTTSTELFDPATGTWSYAASTNAARYLSGITLLRDGKVLATGGVITKYPMSSAEIYDPASNAWTLTASMITGRYAHTSTLLSDGTVLLAGGQGQAISCGKACTGFIPTAKAEIFNETAGTFTAAASLNRAVAYHATTALANGRALVNGGSGYTATCCVVVSDSAFYTPLTLGFSPSSLNFGFLEAGLATGPQTITATNLSFHSSTFSGIASSGDFTQTNTCPPTLAPTQACTIAVIFKPSKAGTRNGFITLRDNDPGSPAQTIALTGIGETLSLGFSPSSLSLGSVAVGSSTIQTATLLNDGASPVNLSGITISPANGTFKQTNNCPASLAVQQSCSLQIVFTPPDVFTYTATLSIANGAGAAAKLPLSGTGLD